MVAGEVERESGVERECVGLCVRGDGEREESFVVFFNGIHHYICFHTLKVKGYGPLGQRGILSLFNFQISQN